jgi:hypothetical protein
MRDLRQLGFSYLVYPSAVHTRFSHSLGSYWLAKRIGNFLLVTDEEKRDFMDLKIAALLHDIGHGPFSHSLEDMFMPGLDHDDISCNIIIDKKLEIAKILTDNGVDPKKITEIISGEISKDKIIPKYLHKIISSQLDVDRFDFLLRDSMMSGNPHGGFDIERIIQTLKKNKRDDLYVGKGGCDAVEHYLTCRYQMYKQVYFHHTTLAAEEFIRKFLLRARCLYSKGLIKYESKYESKLKMLMEPALSLSDFIELTDSDIIYLIKTCKNCDDPILKDFYKRFEKRNLFKTISCPIIYATKISENEDKIKGIISKYGFDPEYYYSLSKLKSKKAYYPYDPKDPEDSIFINEDCTKEISTEKNYLSMLKAGEQISIFVPDDDCRNEVKKILSVD